MSNKKDEITKIEDLPEIDRSQEEEDFTNLTDMAYKMGIETSQDDESENEDDQQVNAEEDSFYSSSQDDDPHEDKDENEATSFYSYSENDNFDSNDYETTFDEGDNFNEIDFQNNETQQDSFDGSEQEFDEPTSNFENFEEPLEDLNLQESNPSSDHEITSEDFSKEDSIDPEASKEFLNELTNIDNKIGLNDPSTHISSPEEFPGDDIEEPNVELDQIPAEIDTKDPSDELDSYPVSPINKTPIPLETPDQWEQPKTLNEITSFANSTSYGNFQGEATPPFSIILKGFKYFEDLESIASILDELKIMGAEDKDNIISSMRRGQLLIPRLSEYAAIIICHKLRHFDLEITMGLTEEIHPPKSYESNDKGFTNKTTLSKNVNYHKGFTNDTDIITTSLPQLTDYKIIQHLGIVSHVLTLSANDIINNGYLEDEIISQSSNENEISRLRIQRENSFASQSEYIKLNQFMNQSTQKDFKPSLNTFYQKAITELKMKARKEKANSILGINFQILPFNINQNRPQYQIMATGNLAWIEKN